ncbi:unnamed protein product [Brassicogethes aeneus]|uniref:Peptidase S1 domain-containing protein n=1 Tax=Brassicogethes aeneus TaxID=1431903 RepID=A0A9P0AZE3_BRAAE|nr:unnamed protein product [Brassicogethes aeneus]
MFCYLIVLALVALTLGEKAKITDYPYQLSLEGLGTHFCGAAIIGEKWALTAAHCVDGFTTDNIAIRAASEVVEEGGIKVQIKTMHKHNEYSPQTLDYDLAILELATTIPFGKNASSIPLVKENAFFPENTTATITGWGFLSVSSKLGLSRYLQVTKVPIVSKEHCRKAYVGKGRITDNMICAGIMEDGQENCLGDTGGPLVINGFLAGIVSWSSGFQASDFLIRVGSSIVDQGGQVINVSSIFQHPKFEYNKYDYDLSLLKLTSNITLTPNSTAIPLNESDNYIKVGTEATITGWGMLKEHDLDLPAQLQVVTVPVLSIEVCKAAYGEDITDRMFCAGYLEGGKDSCLGDSGGPISVNNVLAGVISWGIGCAVPKYPGVYTNISNPILREYIKEVTGI